MEKISVKNYFDSISNIGIKNLPDTLKKSHEFVDRATHNGNDWSKYEGNETIHKTIDLYFEKLNEYLSKSDSAIDKETVTPITVKEEKKVVKPVKQKVAKNKTARQIKRKSVIQTPEQAAKDLIRSYVLRGDSLESLKQSYLGSTNSEYSASIRANKITVDRVNEKKVNVSFSLAKLYNEILEEKGGKSNKEVQTNVKQVEHLDEDVKIIKTFVGFHKKEKTFNAIRNLLSRLQKSVTQKLITKDSPNASEIRIIQDKLVQLLNMGESNLKGFIISINETLLKKLVMIAGGEKVYKSIEVIKRYIGLQGKNIEAEKAHNFVQQIERAISTGKISKEDPYFDKVKSIIKKLNTYIAGKEPKVAISKSELNGLMGIVEGCSCEVNGLGSVDEDESEGKIMNSMDFTKLRFQTLGFTGEWLDFIGDPAPGFSAMVFGKPKYGKSYLCINWAGYLSKNFGKVLFVAKEETLDKTLQMKVQEMGVQNANLDLSDFLPNDLSQYQFVFIDSISKLGLTPEDLTQLKKQYPKISFIYIFQVTKEGAFRGRNDFQHDVDIVIEVPKPGLAVQYGRYNQGGEMEIFNEA